MGQLRVDEFAGNRKDQARLYQWIERVEKIGKLQTGDFICKRRHWGLNLHCLKNRPPPKSERFVSTDAERDLQHFQTADFLAQRRVETRSTLFDVSEVEGRYVRDCLDMVITREVWIRSAVEIIVVPGNGSNFIESQGLRERSSEVRVCRASIADEPTGVYVQLHQIGETSNILCAGRLAALESLELVEVDRVRAFGLQISVEKSGMTDFIDGVAGDVLRAIAVQVRQSDLIIVQLLVGGYFNGWIITDTTQFRVLCPKIAFDQLGCSQESENCDITSGKRTTTITARRRLSKG